MANSKISNAAACAACDAVVDKLDAGAGAGLIQVYTSPQPAGVDVAVGAQVKLIEFTLSDPAFGSAADANPGGRATASAIAAADGLADGVAAWYRAVDSDGNGVLDGDVGEAGSGANMILDSTTIGVGVSNQITEWTVTVPEG